MNDSLGFLISDTGRTVRKVFNERARRNGITRPQWRALVHLKRQPGLKQATLAEFLDVEPISLSRMIDRLEESGMVERRSDPQDRRAWCLHLTEKSEPFFAQMQELSDELHSDMMAGMDAGAQAQLGQMLTQVRDNLRMPCAQESKPAKERNKQHG